LNGSPLSAGEVPALTGGDRIRMGQTELVLVFVPVSHYRLRVHRRDEKKAEVFPLTRGTTSIGRARGCDLLLGDPQVAERHALLHFTENGFFWEQLCMVNPSFVNGVSVPAGQRRRLMAKDIVQISEETALLLEEG